MTRSSGKEFAWPIMAGLVLAILGWQTPRDPILQPSNFWSSQAQISVYPYNARAEDGDGPLELIPERLGRFYRGADKGEVRVRKASWEEDVVLLTASSPPLVLGVCTPPEAAFRVVAEHWVAGDVTLLPEEKKLEIRDGYYRLPPGQYQLMLASKEALPKVVALTLPPGARRDLSPSLQELPRIPALPSQPVSSGGVTLPSGTVPSLPPTGPSRPSSPPAAVQPPPRPRPPVQQPPPQPAPRPQPVFTPVAPPQPQPQPAPLFTPVP